MIQFVCIIMTLIIQNGTHAHQTLRRIHKLQRLHTDVTWSLDIVYCGIVLLGWLLRAERRIIIDLLPSDLSTKNAAK